MIKIGMIIGDRYEILEKIGTGGMSDVYKAKDHKLNRFVAVKVLKQEFSENANFVSKFRIEAQAAAGLMHPNIVNVYDVGEENGIYYIVMELVEGITLKKYIEKNRDTVKSFLACVLKGYRYICDNSAEKVAEALAPSFVGIDKVLIAASVTRYLEIDAWCHTPVMKKESFDFLQNIMTESGNLSGRADFDKAVDNSIAKELI